MRTLFGDWTTGTIDRGGFILWTVILFVIAAIFIFLLGGSAALVENTIGTEGSGAPALGGLALIGTFVFMIAFAIAQINLVAKRTRDIGWSVPLVVILYIIGVPLVWLVLAIVKGRGATL